MSIVNIEAFSIKCDNCGKQYEGEQFAMWYDVDTVIEEASESGWILYHEDAPDNHYCGNCASIDENDHLVLTPHP